MSPPVKPRALLSWSSGKDSAWALRELRARGEVDVVGLITTIDDARRVVAAHGIAVSLVEAQARAVGLPLRTVEVPWPSSNEVYEARMGEAFRAARADGVTGVAFGDLHLEDIRAYRERLLAGTGLAPIFPLWGSDTRELARAMIAGGLRAQLVAVDTRQVHRDIAGRMFDEDLLAMLPPSCDPCGENGEFHTFAFDGPMFHAKVAVSVRSVHERDGFVFTELVAPRSEERYG
ncbi:Hypothetical protein A7982_08014 [Minicystis rosea]|nr:Hypothetical protein A7982_08014 [Minicystis rosea]